MSSISSIPSSVPGLGASQLQGLAPRINIGTDAAQLTKPAAGGFGSMLDGLVSMVDAKQVQANELTKKVLLGDTDQLHQSVIAMQEASTAFSLMVEVRNKLVDSYQELMRMQV
ncbi:MAG TPA: flagellar hook-basal body complex protein FliE [Candidatus Didemnitutus sp.]|nr:flagellar hook-basal body complex protein FliE [Candidatus Didemnitutus sp.]